MLKGKKILVAGGTGTIGIPLVKSLISLGSNVQVMSIDSPKRAKTVFGTDVFFVKGDFRNYEVCNKATKGKDIVINLIAVKGNSLKGVSNISNAFVTFLTCNTNLMEAAFRNDVERFLFVGSICEYPAIDFRHEDDLWHGPPQSNDRYTGIAKRAGEAQAEAYYQEYHWDAVRIVRPSNVYGPYDDFDPKTAQVIPALINRMVNGENPVTVYGDGTAVRDFIYSEDVVLGMLLALEKAPCCLPINLGAGKGITIKKVAENIANLVPSKPQIIWDKEKPIGDKKRVLITDRAKEIINFVPNTSLNTGIKQTIEWYINNKDLANNRGKELHN